MTGAETTIRASLLFLIGLVPPICWLLGWRPGALAGSVLLALIGVQFSLNLAEAWGLGLFFGLPLDLHVLLIGVLLWDWKRAAKQRLAPVLASPSND